MKKLLNIVITTDDSDVYDYLCDFSSGEDVVTLISVINDCIKSDIVTDLKISLIYED